jgi:hypothetical protein
MVPWGRGVMVLHDLKMDMVQCNPTHETRHCAMQDHCPLPMDSCNVTMNPWCSTARVHGKSFTFENSFRPDLFYAEVIETGLTAVGEEKKLNWMNLGSLLAPDLSPPPVSVHAGPCSWCFQDDSCPPLPLHHGFFLPRMHGMHRHIRYSDSSDASLVV